MQLPLKDKNSRSEMFENEHNAVGEVATSNEESGCDSAQGPSADADAAEQVVVQPEVPTASRPSSKDIALAKHLAFVGDELQCSICTELFIQAMTLSCGHSFCKHCIKCWQKKSSFCPICRAKITSQCQTRILDTLIEKLQNQSEELANHRLEVSALRAAADQPPMASASTVNSRKRSPPTSTEATSDDDSDSDQAGSGDSYRSNPLERYRVHKGCRNCPKQIYNPSSGCTSGVYYSRRSNKHRCSDPRNDRCGSAE